MSSPEVFVQALALGLARAWGRHPDDVRHDEACRLTEVVGAAEIDGVRSYSYSSIGLEPGVDLLLWRLAPTLDALQASARAIWSSTRSQRAPIGTSCRRRRVRAS